MKGGLLVDNKFSHGQDKNLTVRKTSLFFAGDGFTVYDCKGTLVFRVDSYGGPNNRDNDEVVLMDAHGRCLLTLRRKRPSLRRRWEGYLGERTDGQKPIFGVRRSSMIGRNSVTVEVYAEYECSEYLIEGNFGQRSCTVVEAETRRKVAEIRRKVDASTNVMLGKDVFSLNVKAGFDGAFAMGLVLVLDQIYGDDYVEVGEEQVLIWNYEVCYFSPTIRNRQLFSRPIGGESTGRLISCPYVIAVAEVMPCEVNTLVSSATASLDRGPPYGTD